MPKFELGDKVRNIKNHEERGTVIFVGKNRMRIRSDYYPDNAAFVWPFQFEKE